MIAEQQSITIIAVYGLILNAVLRKVRENGMKHVAMFPASVWQALNKLWQHTLGDTGGET